MSGIVVFVQAEDGIRDLVRSRGLGDVYKRQTDLYGWDGTSWRFVPSQIDVETRQIVSPEHDLYPVSYTHLTLPTSDLV